MEELQIQRSVGIFRGDLNVMTSKRYKVEMLCDTVERLVYRESGHSIITNGLCSGGKRRD